MQGDPAGCEPRARLQRGEGRLRVHVPGEVRFWMFVLLVDYEMNSLLGGTGPASCCVGFVPVPAAPVLGNADLHTKVWETPWGPSGSSARSALGPGPYPGTGMFLCASAFLLCGLPTHSPASGRPMGQGQCADPRVRGPYADESVCPDLWELGALPVFSV